MVGQQAYTQDTLSLAWGDSKAVCICSQGMPGAGSPLSEP